MKFAPLSRDPAYRRDIFAISGAAIRETTQAFIERQHQSASLLQLLNEHLPRDQYPIDLNDLLNPHNSWTHEFAFYLSMFCKELIRDPHFRFGQGSQAPVGKGHKIYEKGQMENIPWGLRPDGSEVKDFALHNCRVFILYLEEIQPGASIEFFNWINCLLKPGYCHKEEFLDGRAFWCSLEFMHYSLELYKVLTNSDGSVTNAATRTVFQARWLAQFLLPLSGNFIRMAIKDVASHARDIRAIQVTDLAHDRLNVQISANTELISANIGPFLPSAWENLCQSWAGALTGLFTLKHRDLENIECSIQKQSESPHPDFEIRLSRKIPSPSVGPHWWVTLVAGAACAALYLVGIWLTQSNAGSLVNWLIASNIGFAGLALALWLRHTHGKKLFNEQRAAAMRQLQAYERSTSQLLISKTKPEKLKPPQSGQTIAPPAPTILDKNASQALLEQNLRAGKLSQRDIEVARLVCQGLADKEIAQILNVANQTISNRLSRLYRRLEVNSRSALVAKLFSPQR